MDDGEKWGLFIVCLLICIATAIVFFGTGRDLGKSSCQTNLIENNILEYKTDKFGKTYIVATDSIYNGIAKYYGGK